MTGPAGIRLSTVVMAHPSRREQAEQLRRRHPELDIEIVYDPEPEVRGATLRTAVAAWSRIADGATHHLVLQEDVQLCRDFRAVVLEALSVAPAGAVALFCNWTMSTSQAVRLAAVAGASWTPVVDSFVPTQALALPADVARGFAAFTTRYASNKPDNRAMAEYLEELGLATHVAVPHLVQHRPVQSVLLNDLLFGVRDAVVFPPSAEIPAGAFTERVARPPALAHLGLGAFETMSNYQRLAPGGEPPAPVPSHEVLLGHGFCADELVAAFAADRERHPEAPATGRSDSMLFQFWVTSFLQGVIARGLLGPGDRAAFGAALDRAPWPRLALGTFAASALRKMEPPRAIRRVAGRLAPLCVTATGSGYVAAGERPDLGRLGRAEHADAV